MNISPNNYRDLPRDHSEQGRPEPGRSEQRCADDTCGLLRRRAHRRDPGHPRRGRRALPLVLAGSVALGSLLGTAHVASADEQPSARPRMHAIDSADPGTSRGPVFDVAPVSMVPNHMVFAPDGNYWGTVSAFQNGSGAIVKSDTHGNQTSYPLDGSTPSSITVGPDQNLWFTYVSDLSTDTSTSGLGRLLPSGKMTTFPFDSNTTPVGITVGDDGRLWWIESTGSPAPSVATASVDAPTKVTRFALPADSEPVHITRGRDRRLWITDQQRDSIWAIDGRGTSTEYPLTAGVHPTSITSGPDGALWFTEAGANRIGRITTSGVISHSAPLDAADMNPDTIVTGLDGSIWFGVRGGYRTASGADSAAQLGRIDSSLAVQLFSIPGITSHGAIELTTGPRGRIGLAVDAGAEQRIVGQFN